MFSWQLERSTDVSGNEIRYRYDRTSSPGVAYLARIEYGQGASANRSVDFVLNPATAPRPDRPVSARAGFRQQLDRRVTAVEVRASGALVARYDLGYVQDPDSTRSQLAEVRRVGSDGLTALQPTDQLREPAPGVVLMEAERWCGDAVVGEKPGCPARILSRDQVDALQDSQCP